MEAREGDTEEKCVKQYIIASRKVIRNFYLGRGFGLLTSMQRKYIVNSSNQNTIRTSDQQVKSMTSSGFVLHQPDGRDVGTDGTMPELRKGGWTVDGRGHVCAIYGAIKYATPLQCGRPKRSGLSSFLHYRRLLWRAVKNNENLPNAEHRQRPRIIFPFLPCRGGGVLKHIRGPGRTAHGTKARLCDLRRNQERRWLLVVKVKG